MKLYWWNDRRNLGDALMPLLVERLSGETVTWAPIGEADMIAGGSILEIAHDRAKPGTPVWGAGFICEGRPWLGPALDFRAVRGPLSAERTGCGVHGDPAVLAPMVWDPQPHGRVVLLPHYADTGAWVKLNATSETMLLTATDPPDRVVPLIAGASAVITSSLHGLILAEAYGVPATRVMCEKVVGGGYKFDDYQASKPVDREALLAAAPWT